MSSASCDRNDAVKSLREPRRIFVKSYELYNAALKAGALLAEK
jgi:hypothetical protein